MILDQYLVWITSGFVAAVWLVADFTGHPLTQGTQAALGSLAAMALLKSKTDSRWRKLELERSEMQALVEKIETATPGSPDALAVRRELVDLARRAQAEGEE